MNNLYEINDDVYVVFQNRVKRGQIKQISQTWDKAIEYMVEFDDTYHSYIERLIYRNLDDALKTLDERARRYHYIGRWYKNVNDDDHLFLMLSHNDDGEHTYAVYDKNYNFLYTYTMNEIVELEEINE